MPALITHDFFGREVYDACRDAIGLSPEERNAFLLGNQGPDPLFYLVITPRMKPFFGLGSAMHRIDPARLLAAFAESLDVLEEDERSAGRAYLAGFLCHYLLDRAMHPFVYSQQFAVCDAGVEGLSRKNGSDVHAEIEREFDEMVLFAKTGRTVASFRPHREILRASGATLAALGKMHELAAIKAMRAFTTPNTFPIAVKNFRLVQSAFYSPKQHRARAAAFVETHVLRREFSFFKAMSHRDNACDTSDFDNRTHAAWENPFTGEMRTESFWDIFDATCAQAPADVAAILAPGFDEAAARNLTRGLNFSGEPASTEPGGIELDRSVLG